MKKTIKPIASLLAVIFGFLMPAAAADQDPLAWYKDAVVYEAFVRSFYDSDADGIGDIKGLLAKLDYLNDGDPKTDSDLEISALWLMPICASPSYHGYDVTDYYQVNPQYGTMKDFETLLAEAHRRGIKIIIDLVVNHTSNLHPLFRESQTGPQSPRRSWYVWRKDLPPGWKQPWDPNGKPNTVWHKDGDWYYYGIFYFGMPDLNYRNPQVTAEMLKIFKFWLDKGVDGFRLDAIRYLVEEGPNLGQSDTQGTHRELATLYQAAKAVNNECLLVGEVWTDLDTVASYYKSVINPAQVDSCFNFDLAGALVEGLQNNSFNKINAVMEITQETYPPGAIDSIFLTNHDMDRIASIIGPDPAKLKLAASLLLTLPGVPYIYYGEEIGMMGRKPDEMIRRPLRWDKSRYAGFTTAERPWINPDTANPDFTVADMQKDNGSLLHHYKTMIRLRNRSIALRQGSYRVVKMSVPTVYGYLRSHEQQNLLVVHSFSAANIPGITTEDPLTIKTDLLRDTAVSVIGPLAPYQTKVFAVETKAQETESR